MDGQITRYRPAWKQRDPDETPYVRKPRKVKPVNSILTAEQDRWLLDAWKLRQTLTDKAIAKHLGITIGQVWHQLRRVRGV